MSWTSSHVNYETWVSGWVAGWRWRRDVAVNVEVGQPILNCFHFCVSVSLCTGMCIICFRLGLCIFTCVCGLSVCGQDHRICIPPLHLNAAPLICQGLLRLTQPQAQAYTNATSLHHVGARAPLSGHWPFVQTIRLRSLVHHLASYAPTCALCTVTAESQPGRYMPTLCMHSKGSGQATGFACASVTWLARRP